MIYKVTISGQDKLFAKLDRVSANVVKKMELGLDQTAREVVRIVKEKTPVGTGALVNAIDVTLSRPGVREVGVKGKRGDDSSKEPARYVLPIETGYSAHFPNVGNIKDYYSTSSSEAWAIAVALQYRSMRGVRMFKSSVSEAKRLLNHYIKLAVFSLGL